VGDVRQLTIRERNAVNEAEYFPRLAAVPGIAYSGPPDIDREKLPGAKAKPRTRPLSFEGKPESFLSWETEDGGITSQSPAAARASSDRDTTAPSVVLRRVYEALELPGSVADYHFALLSAYQLLRKHCRSNPGLLEEFERLCLLDLSLVQARPEAIMHGTYEKPIMARVPAVEHLIHLYEREGFLEDALAVARIAAACGKGTDDQNRLMKRIQELKAEDA
jgi:hypothetical protein